MELFVVALLAQQPKPAEGPHPDEAKVEEAIKKGCESLFARLGGDAANKKGKVEPPEEPGKYAPGPRSPLSLVVLTLAHSGYTDSDPKFAKLLESMLSSPLDSTYTVAIQAMALQKIDAKKYQWRIAQCAQFLVDNQCENGEWGQGVETPFEHISIIRCGPRLFDSTAPRKYGDLPGRITILRKRKGPDKGDSLNSYWGALGIRHCLYSGIEIEREVVQRAREYWVNWQKEDGSWDDVVPGGTYRGLAAHCTMTFYLKLDFKTDPHSVKAVDWISKNFNFSEDSGFSFYSIERAGTLYGVQKFGKFDWYPEAVKVLLEKQKQDGSWSFGSNSVEDTCFSLLSLKLREVVCGLPWFPK